MKTADQKSWNLKKKKKSWNLEAWDIAWFVNEVTLSFLSLTQNTCIYLLGYVYEFDFLASHQCFLKSSSATEEHIEMIIQNVPFHEIER